MSPKSMNSEINNCGYLYVAKSDIYLNEAIKSAASLKKSQTKYPVCLITDVPFEADIFDKIIIIPLPDPKDNKKNGYLTKIVGMINSPFQKTIYIDTDTFVIDNCDELFTILEYFDLLISHDYQENSFANINGKELNGYHTYNTGVIAFNKNQEVINFLHNWQGIFISKMSQYWSDQPAFMEALLYNNLKTYSLQTIYNFRFNQYLPISYLKVKILHGRNKKIEEIAELVNESNEHRVWDPRRWTIHSWYKPKTLKEYLYSIKKRILNILY